MHVQKTFGFQSMIHNHWTGWQSVLAYLVLIKTLADYALPARTQRVQRLGRLAYAIAMTRVFPAET